jgi:hypothetical protein
VQIVDLSFPPTAGQLLTAVLFPAMKQRLKIELKAGKTWSYISRMAGSHWWTLIKK